MRLPQRDESGFTLVELLVALVIEALIMAALGMAFSGILRGTSQVSATLDKSEDARIAAAYIISDARNSSGPETSLSDTTSCPDPSPPVSGTATPVVRFDWNSTSSAGVTTAYIVNYVLVSHTLLRRVCSGGSLVSDHAVGTNVQSVTAVCSPTANCSGAPTSITVTISETTDTAGGTYQYSLTGAFEKLIGDGAPPVPSNPQSVVLLGAGGACSGSTNTIDIQGSGSMRVYGDAFIDSTNGPGTPPACSAMYVANSGHFQSGGLSIPTGGSCVSGTNGLPCPTVTGTTGATDPYASLAVPTTTAPPLTSQTGCTGAQSTQTAQPGLYASGFTLGGGDTCTLASGIYVIKGGFNVANGATLKTGAGGVMIYIMTGAFTVGGGAAVTLTAMTSGIYSGLVMWQATVNSVITFANGGALVFNGAIYGPKAQLNISGNAQTPYVTSLVVQTVVLSNSGGITVGAASATPLSINETSLPPWTVNRPYSATLTSAGGDGNDVWSATGLPTGLGMNASTGVISGTPTIVSAPSVTVTLNDQLGDNPDTLTTPLTISGAPSISTASMPNGTVGTAYSGVTMAATGGTSPYDTWAATNLPGGLSINASTGAISGTPTASGTFSSILVTAKDSAGASTTAHAAYSITINPAATLTSTSPSSLGQGATSQTITINGTGFVTGAPLAAFFSGTGITVNSTGFVSSTQVHATITLAAGATVGARTVTLTNGDGGAATGSTTFTVNAAPTVTSISPVSVAKSGNTAVTINGTGFAAGATVSLTCSNAPAVSNVVVVTGIKITAKFTATNKSTTCDVVVKNTDFGSGKLTAGFAVI